MRIKNETSFPDQRKSRKGSGNKDINYAKVVNEMRKLKKSEGSIRPHSEQQPEKPNKINHNQKLAHKGEKPRDSSSNSLKSNKNSLDFLSESLLSNVSSIEKNLKKALFLQSQASNNNEVYQYIESIGLSQYLEVFIENGFDDLEVLKELQREHLFQMNIPKEHHDLILRKIHSIKKSKKDVQKEVTNPEKKSLKSSENQRKSVKFADSENLGVGEFDEAQSHAYFLEALMEFRTGKMPPKEEKKQEESAKSTAFFYANDSEWRNTFIDQSVGSENGIQKKEYLFCWECLSKFEKNQKFCSYSKTFCSEKCMGSFRLQNERSCFKCKRVFLKCQGDFLNEKWFCSNECEPKLQEIFEDWKRKNPKIGPKIHPPFSMKKRADSKEKEIEIDLGINDYEEDETETRGLGSFE